ncbi:acetyl-CoA carboxylase biotin carboxyl carrier protein [Marinomonas profundimaris]|jgi:acetyl-CoA carboxylase biotin carboxyl carrier protein|uniref:Biotin carboxyl carrier protein of acetyl-CoA carboxylase n=1 Tax=Marinomonas profundimaris TaxID=1208321 RepID=W1RPI9_9GAMM|nr:acetyl-CoA carboxylase biotin carboxyl carrier protein [Marinomonas profundimaris]ETI58776.1 acetyl-CoA carboxylase biotin carboxyl carrier protein [Marinomonas profundimaris]
MDSQKITSLVELMSSSGLSELTYQEGEVSLTLHRSKQNTAGVTSSSNFSLPSDTVSEPTDVSESDHHLPQAEIVLSTHDNSDVSVQSPLYGVVYLSPSEDEKAYVSVGDSVIEGQTLCLLEAMKMFHPIEAEASGTVREIRVASGDEVESGQVLFVIG